MFRPTSRSSSGDTTNIQKVQLTKVRRRPRLYNIIQTSGHVAYMRNKWMSGHFCCSISRINIQDSIFLCWMPWKVEKWRITTRCISIVKPTRCTSFSNLFYFCSSTLYISDGLSVRHQESKTVHTTTGISQTDSADCLLAGTRLPASKQSAESVWHILDAVCTVLDSWWRTERPS